MHPFYNYDRVTFWLVLALLLVVTTATKAQECAGNKKFRVGLVSGYAREDFRWSIGGKTDQSGYVNILSELKWKRLSGIAFGFDAGYNFYKDFVLRTSFSGVMLTSGNVSDTDYGKDNRRDTLFHGRFRSDKGSTYGVDLAVGYKLKLRKKGCFLPLLGYGINLQSLYILGDPGNFIGTLRSTYQARWNGLMAGYTIEMPVYGNLSIRHQFFYHHVNYAAKANWNLIEDFKHPVSFKHKAKGYGLTPGITLMYSVNKRINVCMGGRYDYWITGKGTDILYRSDGTIDITQFNGAIRNRLTASAGVMLRF